ncbi:MAG TPA: hypothetical protein VML19_11530, partial [Verrucomicrobiae bacterium]|nr:hypothetical protein [Verrucomicrobiae bacterium]
VAPVEHREQLRKLVVAVNAARHERQAAYYGNKPVPAAKACMAVAPAGAPPMLPVAMPQSLPFDAPLTEILRHGCDVLITPELAERIERECIYARERDIDPDRLKMHVSDINAGRFRQGTVLSFGLLKGKLIRVDGRTRGKAVIDTGKPQIFHITIHPVANEAELADLHSIFDPPGSARSPIDAAGHLVAAGKLTKGEVKVLLRAAPYIDAEFRLSEMPASAKMAQSPTARNQTAQACYPPAVQYFSRARRAPRAIKEMLYRQAIAAFAIYTFRHLPQKAAEFWGAIATLADEDKGLPSTDPRRALYKRLQSRDESTPIQLLIVAKAWNAFFEGRKLREIRVKSGEPFRIAGTVIVDVTLEGAEDAA